jgi:DNA-binding transcriptional ArsR family regulator
MDEIIVRLARTLACLERLRILSCLVAEGESSPHELGRRLRIAPNALSMHLAKLTAVGLIKRRRSGAWSYCVAESPYGPGTLSGMTLNWLKEVLAQPKQAVDNCGLHEVRNSSSLECSKLLHDLVFEAATAFTDLRRLQILRHLAREGECAADVLGDHLQMSAWAVGRHTDKLVRRGYLCSRRAGDAVFYRLAETFKTPLHARLWKIVHTVWEAELLRTS